MTGKYTAGPWESGPRWEISSEGRLIALVMPTEVDVIQAKYNFKLMRAAPELLEALQAVVAIADRDTDVFNAAKAAIAKATGVDAMIKARG
ncbi:hypothetical protein LH412_21115 [Yersinia intermedia]|uniref:hypothetical protein n=1 Tax=Yersinia intermedia TaxID=631 RepID=UPI001CFDF6A0|nr:hypothetical protein [Yersinia intermedia]MCB5324494.1 hypothetical protein [Yersinia intermedia]